MLYAANSYLARENTTKEGRRAVADMIESVLVETGNYRGFAVKEGAAIPVYSDEAPIRHFYFVSGNIDADYDMVAKKTCCGRCNNVEHCVS